jgi:hypothetical protein
MVLIFVLRGPQRADISRAAELNRSAAGAMPFAGVAELVDARDLGSRDESRGGSSPSARTTPGRQQQFTPAGGRSQTRSDKKMRRYW